MSNRLAAENSLYLKQDADNPVDWWPWCPEAFEAAKEECKLVIVSIGYSACHWCHVMAHQCFEDGYIAELMNKYFICIKVDREERPDIDQIYMEAVQMLTQRGGWPLNVFCLSDGRPFFGGTYFPPEDKGQGIIPWPQLLMRIVDHYKKSPNELIENADNILKNLDISNQPMGATGDPLRNTALLGGAQAICMSHDDDWGGFGEAPKFPPSMVLDYLLKIRGIAPCEAKNPALPKCIDKVVVKTLKGMAHGGLFDQIGGGFYRYSVDKFWVIPHFEKMLYDNALLIDIYTKGWLRYRSYLFKSIVEETVEWLKREMVLDNGAFASALDADTEGVEGKYYVWRPEEIKEVLGEEDAKIFCDVYNITEEGNFEGNTSNPTWVYDSDEMRQSLKPLRQKLLEARQARTRPVRDGKVLVAWNSLMIRALVQAGFYFGRKDWLEMACKAADFIWRECCDDGRLKSVYYNRSSKLDGYLDDYTYYAEACLMLASKTDWVKPGTSADYIKRAQIIINNTFKHFADKHQIGFFYTSDDHELLITRKKVWLDNAMPAGNSSLVHSLSMLYALTGEGRYSHELNELRKAYAGFATRAPNAVAYALAGFVSDAMETRVLKVKNIDDLNAVQASLVSKPYRDIFIFSTKDESEGKSYQLCVGSQCLEPTENLSAVISKL